MSEKTYRMRVNTTSLPRLTDMTIFVLGVLALAISIMYTSSILAFVGLGMIFWGVILTYIRSDEYIRKNLLTATATPALLTLNQTLLTLEYNGKPVYLPPKYLNNPDESKAYIPKIKNTKLPTPEQTQKLETQNPSRNSQGILVTPPGVGLTKLFEKTLGTNFTRTDINQLIQNLPRIVIEDLEIATNLEIATETANLAEPTDNNVPPTSRTPGKIHVTITDSIFNEISREIEKMENIWGNLGCPLTSAIACAIAKAMGKLTIIEEEKTSQDGQTKEVVFSTYEEE